MRIRFSTGRVVDAAGDRTETVVVENGRISGDTLSPCDEVIARGNLVLMPAFTDTHCHLRDPGYPEKETMETGMKAALRGGYTTLCAMANTQPVCDTPALVLANQEKAARLSLCRLVQAGAAGIGLSDETPTDYEALSKVTRVLSNDGKTIFSDDFMRNLLLASEKYGFLVSTHCQPERATVRRDLALLRETGGRLHVGHISCKETAEMIRLAKREGLNVTCEVMPHHIFGWDNPYKVNPPFRTESDARALIAAIADGTVDVLATDHAPHTEVDKAGGAAGISNIEHAAAIFWQVFTENDLPLTLLSKRMSEAPALLLQTGTGRIEAGAAADLILFDPDECWTIDKDDMISRSHNTPFSGRQVRGRVRLTMTGGKILYDDRPTLS